MHFFRNPEIKKCLMVYGIFTLIAVTGAAVTGTFAGGYVFIVCVSALLLFILFTVKRYKDISRLSYQLDAILHGTKRINFVPDKEGELALLSSEIYKMITRLQEQSELLKTEKNYLSSSIADISHQIKTPLTSIRMIVPRLGRKDLSPEKKSEYVRELGSLLTRIEWLITALLKIAQLESGCADFEQTSVKVTELIQKALAPLEILIEVKGVSLDTSISSDTYFTGDFSWSVEAVGNILKNCLEHTPDKGTLEITASENPLYTEIFICDTGAGIDSKDLSRLFERFYKGKNSGPENVGIGLALSRMIIQRQNGTIQVKNRSPHGAEFHIRFYKGAI